jgi:hypothetical protein
VDIVIEGDKDDSEKKKREHRQSFDAAINHHFSKTLVGRRMMEESLLATCTKRGLFVMQRISHVRRMKAICCSNQGSLSRRDAIVADLTHKEILRPNAIATVG